MKRKDPRQLDMIDWIDAHIAADRPSWNRMAAISRFEDHIAAFHETAVAGDRRAQDVAILDLNAFVRQVHDDSEHWKNKCRDGSDSTHPTRMWLLRTTQYLGDGDLLLGQAFAETVSWEGEQCRIICDGLSSTRVTVKAFGKPDRHYWAGLGMTGFHNLQGRTPLEYIVSRCVLEHAA